MFEVNKKGKILKSQTGQALVEYVLIIALVSVVIIGLVNWLGGFVKDQITRTSCSVLDQEYVNEKNVPGEGKCKEKE